MSNEPKEIILADGSVTLVDADVWTWAKDFHWFRVGSRAQYVGRAIKKNGKRTTVRLHRLIMNAPDGIEVDHINRNPLDNRRSNLRLATHSQNLQNIQSVPRITGHRNVEFVAGRKRRYRVRIRVNRKHIHIGCFFTLEEAAEAARQARLTYMTHAPDHQAEHAE